MIRDYVFLEMSVTAVDSARIWQNLHQLYNSLLVDKQLYRYNLDIVYCDNFLLHKETETKVFLKHFSSLITPVCKNKVLLINITM